MNRAVVIAVVVGLLGSLLPTQRAQAADTIEAWDVGVSDYEMYVAGASGDEPSVVSGVVGAGITDRFSLGVTTELAWIADERAGRWGLTAFYALYQGSVELDLLGDLGSDAFGVDGRAWQLGFELSLPGYAVVPYTRDYYVGSADDGFEAAALLVGSKVAMSHDRVQVHVELGAEISDSNRPPLSVALGPNITVADSVELIPEVKYVFAEQGAEDQWFICVGAIVTYSVLP
jgi:hypothetical protein